MLAMKTVAADQAVDAMVFDEIDTCQRAHGPGSRREDGPDLRTQTGDLCQPPAQIALWGPALSVEKQEQGGRTSTTVRLLDEEGRIEELSRMVGRGRDGELRTHAAHMLSSARDRATAIRRAEREKRINEHDGED